MHGILLAGGTGSRLYPLTLSCNKHLLPIHDKPMIFYALTTMLASPVEDITLVAGPRELGAYRDLFGDGTHLGTHLTYREQRRPGGVAEGLVLAEPEVPRSRDTLLVLGDNLFCGDGLAELMGAVQGPGATVLAVHVSDPRSYGVVEIDRGRVLSLEEKPARPRSMLAVPGVYRYDDTVFDRARGLRPSGRDELEITDINREYLREDNLQVVPVPETIHWCDAGTHTDLARATALVRAKEWQSQHKVGVPEEMAWRTGRISDRQLRQAAMRHRMADYGDYLLGLLHERHQGAPQHPVPRAG